MTMTRRNFLVHVPSGLGLAVLSGSVAAAPEKPGASVHAEFPSQDPARVREMVSKSHIDIDRVRELVTESPALAKAAWDWGFGDWESALGAASHMGRRDIAELLVSHGARPDLFTFAMLGKLNAVKACIAARPGVQRIPGPHGITLLQHARNGGDRAREVAAYLETVDGADVRATSLEVDDEQKTLYLGRYTFGPGPDDSLEVLIDNQNMLAIRRGKRFSRVLYRVEDHGFAPGGAPDVRVRFAVAGPRAVSVTVHDPHPLVTAMRTD